MSLGRIKIGAQLAPQYGDMKRLREAWIEAEQLGADALYTADHFFTQIHDNDSALKGEVQRAGDGKNFEATTVQAAMAATTSKAEIGCIVHGNSYRNPNLMADMARTIDHISGGRFILGIGSGYFKVDYDEYGYEFGTAKSRLLDLARDLPIIKARFQKLNPPPLRRIPIIVASMGDKLGLRIVAEHADIWHAFGPAEKVLQKQEVLRNICKELGRTYDDIERSTYYMPQVLPESDPDAILNTLGIRNVICIINGPDWDLGQLRELLAWRKRINVTE